MITPFKTKDKIIFLDAGTVDYRDLSFQEIKVLGHFKAYPWTEPSQIVRRAKKATMIITNKCKFDAALLSRLASVRSIHVTATGYNNIDLDAARKNGIAITNVSGYSTESVVQSTFAFLLALANNLVKYNQAAHNGRWSKSPLFVLGTYPIMEINQKTFGIIGYGTIGKRVTDVAKVLGMKVLVARIPGKKYSRKDRVRRVSFERMLRESDFVAVHAPLTDLTRNLIDGQVIRKMKRGAFLINMARGGIVNERALRQALESGRLRGAACDVLATEPPPRNHILLGAPNLLLTPHIAWASLEARTRLVHEVALNIKAFQQGRRRNRVV